MSLLMDALRWAEEANNKVEKEATEGTLSTTEEGTALPTNADSVTATSSKKSEPIENGTAESGISYSEIKPSSKQNLSNNEESSRDAKASIPAPKHATPENPDARPLHEIQDHKPSINALFQAKRATQQQKMRKIRRIAALLLFLPIGGGLYWYYTASSRNQILIPPSASASDSLIYGETASQPDTSGSALNGVNIALGEESISLSENNSVSLSENSVVSKENVALTTEGSVQNQNQNQSNLISQATDSSPNQEALNQSKINMPLENVDSLPNADNIDVEQVAESPQQTTTSKQTLEQTPAPTPRDSSVSQPENTPAISFIRTTTTSDLKTQLNIAYENYQDGNYEMALLQYQNILNLNQNDRNALLGLASVYVKQGRTALAQNLYSRLLKLNPQDPLARAGLIDLTQTVDPLLQESELKSLLKLHPDVAPLAFALGNLYASQSRWSEAQSAYFDASLSAKSSSAGPISPDYPFNLAVSLERLNQLPAAYDYYREALELSSYSVPGFDPELLNSRLEYLEQRLQ